MMPTRSRKTATRRKPGFTIMELMLAVSIIIILTILTVPQFRALKTNLDASAAENTVSVVLNQARNMALRGDHGDTAVVFLYDRSQKMYTLLVASQRVQGLQYTGSTPPPNIPFDIFAPIEGTRERRLPPGWEVRGLGYGARVGSGSPKWYNHSTYWPDPNIGGVDAAWIFPESDETFAKRQTFMVRFAARTGTVITSNEQFANQDAWLYINPNEPFGTLENLGSDDWIDQIFDHGIHLRPTPALALYSVEEMVNRVSGVEINPATGTLYSLSYGAGSDGDGGYLSQMFYLDANDDTHQSYAAMFAYLDENADPIVFNRFTGMIMRSRPQ